MRTFRPVALMALCSLPLLAGGCASRGALDIACVDLSGAKRNFAHDLPLSPLEQRVRGESGVVAMDAEGGGGNDPLDGYIVQALSGNPEAGGAAPTNPAMLLLSGGGQWGAFGAGLLTSLEARGAMPNVVGVTGVSTGALQSLFVGAGLSEHGAAMRAAYRPEKESEIVDRGSEIMAIFRGSIAGLAPLRHRIETAICPDAEIKSGKCPVLDALGEDGAPVVQIGFVEASSGKFQYVTAQEVARAENMSREQKRACLAGAALASVAMPLFFQQVRMNDITYFDGGVRQSVFADFLARRFDTQRKAMALAARQPDPKALPLYVVRNGPTNVTADAGSDGVLNAIDSAKRAQSVIVNEVEVGSITELRLQKPQGPIGFVTADGYSGFKWSGGKPARDTTCGAIKADKANKGAMFVPDFMQCLMAYGDNLAKGDPWKALDPISATP